ncbi:hypothetical protein PTKIN_Ptkin08bG0169100 [Pterospermum kingtungense]
MSTSVAYLVSIGVSPRDIGPMVTQYPYFLGMRVGTVIKPLVDYLVSLGLPKKIFARMLEKRAYILGYDCKETVKPNVDCLISFGIRTEAIASIIAQYLQILGLPLKAKLSSQQYFFNLKLKTDPDGFACVIEKMPQIASLDQNVLMKRIEFLLGDQRFEERLQGDYIESESLGPSFCMGGKLELPGNDIVSDEEDESDDDEYFTDILFLCSKFLFITLMN